MKDAGKPGCLWPTVSPRSPLSKRHSCYLPAMPCFVRFRGKHSTDADIKLLFAGREAADHIPDLLLFWERATETLLIDPKRDPSRQHFARPVLLQ